MIKSTPIVIFGFGNLGSHLFKFFRDNGFQNLLIASNQEGFQNKFAINNGANSDIAFNKCLRSDIDKIKSFLSDKGLVFICVNDSQITDSLKELDHITDDIQRIILSGGYEFNSTLPKNVSVFYPLFSFNVSMAVDWSEVPVFLESPNKLLLQIIDELPLKNVQHLDSKQRNLLHVAAVFANNFTNAIIIAAQELLKSNPNLKFDFIHPILKQTIEKLNKQNAIDVQTGPAKRGDEVTIKKHLEILEPFHNEQILYQAITKYIRAKLK